MFSEQILGKIGSRAANIGDAAGSWQVVGWRPVWETNGSLKRVNRAVNREGIAYSGELPSALACRVLCTRCKYIPAIARYGFEMRETQRQQALIAALPATGRAAAGTLNLSPQSGDVDSSLGGRIQANESRLLRNVSAWTQRLPGCLG